MTQELDDQIAELQYVHRGLTEIAEKGYGTTLSGSLPFEASADRFSPIKDSFEIELIIPEVYPKILPRISEKGGKIERTYDHVNQDGTLCLAIPIEERRIFWEQPSLLGFVNRLVIPYFFGYCHWKKHGEHPFEEQEHGCAGVVQHYTDSLHLKDETSALAIVCYLLEYGYRGHHPCPCGSHEKARKCHGKELRILHEQHTELTLKHDFVSVLDVCLSKVKTEELQIPMILSKQVLRILDNVKH